MGNEARKQNTHGGHREGAGRPAFAVGYLGFEMLMPPELYARLKAYCETHVEDGKTLSRSEVVRRALLAYLDQS